MQTLRPHGGGERSLPLVWKEQGFRAHDFNLYEVSKLVGRVIM